MSDIEEITDAVVKFRDDRDWAQFHDSKSLALAISIEAAELNEVFLWKTIEQAEEMGNDRIKEELADVLVYSFLLASKCSLNIKEIIFEKLKKNAQKYPVEKSKGSSKKYNEL